MPWKDPRDWTTRDYDRLGEIMSEYKSHKRGRQTAPRNVPPPWMSPAMPPAMMMADGYTSDSPYVRHRRGQPPDRDAMVARLERIVEAHEDRMNNYEDTMYGTGHERREHQWRQRQYALWQEFQQAAQSQGMGAGMAGMNGVWGTMNPNMGMGMGMQGMVPAQQFGGMGGAPGMAGMNGMGMNGGMHGPGMDPIYGGGDDMMGAAGIGARPRRMLGCGGRPGFRRVDFDELEDNFGDGIGRREGLRGRRNRQFPGDDDFYGEDYGDGE